MWSGRLAMFPSFFWTLLILTCGYALWRGRTDERTVALACLAASVATRFAVSPVDSRYGGVETGLLAIDAALLLTFVVIALRSQRFWPLWVAGLQLTSSMAHAIKAVDLDLLPKAYGAAAIFWSYPILVILFVATWRSYRRRRHEQDGERMTAAA